MSNERELIIKTIKELESLYSPNGTIYYLSHFYSIEPSKTYIKSTLPSRVVNLFIAYLQFKASEYLEEFSLGEEQAADMMVKYLKAEKVNDIQPNFEIDLYFNWEDWCGTADKITSLDVFNFNGLDEDLKQMVEEYVKEMESQEK